MAGLATAAVLAGIYAWQTGVFAEKAPAPTLQKVPAATGDLQLQVTASGSITTPRAVDLSFRQNGAVEEVYVKVGDSVVAGQPLARIEETSLQFAVRQAEIALKNAQLSLDALLAGASPEDVGAAEASVETARLKLSTMEAGGEAGSIASAEAGLRSAQAKLDALTGPAPADLASGRAAVDTARANLQSAQVKLEHLQNPTPAELSAAEDALTLAQAKLLALRNPTAADIASAQAGVTSAEGSLASAQNALTQLRTPPADQVSDAMSAIKSAEIALVRAQGDMDLLRQDLNDERLRNLVGAYTQLYLARQQLNEARTRGASTQQIEAAETAVLHALRAVQAAEDDAGSYETGVTPTQIVNAAGAIEKAQADLDSAKLRLHELSNPAATDLAASETQVKVAQANLVTAQSRLEQLRTPSAADLLAAESVVNQARSDLDKLRNPQQADIAAAEAAVVSAQASVAGAELGLAQLGNPTAADMAAAEGSLIQAQNQLQDAVAPYKEADLAAQRLSLQQALNQLNKTLTPSTSQEIAKAQLSVEQADLNLAQATHNLGQALLTAPIAGVVSAVNAVPGNQGTGAAVSLVDTGSVLVKLSVDETDIGKVQVGQEASVSVEAAGPLPYRGQVMSIAPMPTVQSGVTTYEVLMNIQPARAPAAAGQRAGQRAQGSGRSAPQGSEAPAGDGPQLRSGMTATAYITYASREDTLLVPARAIKSAGGQRSVQVEANSAMETRTVRVGLTDGLQTEILEGLQEGDVVIIEQTAASGGTAQQRAGAPATFGAGAGFGGGGFGPGAVRPAGP